MTDVELKPHELGRQSLKSLDKSRFGAAASKLFAASIGDVAIMFLRSPTHKHYSLADIEWMVLPPVAAGQFYVAEARHEERFSRPDRLGDLGIRVERN